MIKKRILLSSLLFFSSLFLFFYFLAKTPKKSPKSFTCLSKEAEQERIHLQKDIYLGPQHIQINAESSKIFLEAKDKKISLKENLHEIRCLINGEDVRYLLAEKGVCFYPSQKLLLENGKCYFFHFPLDEKNLSLEDAYLEGSSEKITFDFLKNSLHAENFQAKVKE